MSRRLDKHYNNESPWSSFIATDSQKKLGNVIDNNTITFVEGVAGTGKTTGILHNFVTKFVADKNLQIIVIRTPVEAGSDSVGFLPDKLSDKIAPHFSSAKDNLQKLLGTTLFETHFEKRIKFLIPNFALGCTFDNSLILIDEAQQLQPHILKLILERTGWGSKVVVAGDSNQLYLATSKASEGRQALADAIKRFFDTTNMIPKFGDIGFFKFDIEDIQRHPIVKSVIRAYY